LRTVAEYLERAAEFEALAAMAGVDELRKRYGDIAACYRLLAREREWLIGTGAIEGEEPIGPQRPRSSEGLAPKDAPGNRPSPSHPIDDCGARGGE